MYLKANANTIWGARMTFHGTFMTVGDVSYTSAQTQGEYHMVIPVKKNKKVRVEYLYDSTYANSAFQFYYAEDE